MKKCKDCGHEIDKSTKMCPNCHKNYKSAFLKIVIVIILVIIGVAFLVIIGMALIDNKNFNANNSKNNSSEAIQESAGEIYFTESIKTLKENGLLKSINPNLNEAFVDPLIWNGIEFQTKKNIGRILAFYCGKEKGTNLNWVNIRDNYSGKKLAKYSEAWGFDVY